MKEDSQIKRDHGRSPSFSRPSVSLSLSLGALGLALGVLHVPVTGALRSVTVRSRRHAFAVLAAYSAVLEAPVHHSRVRAPHPAFRVAETYVYVQHSQMKPEKGDAF